MARLQELVIISATIAACALLDGAFANIHTNCTFPDIMNLEEDGSLDHTWRFLSPDPNYNKEHSTGQWSFHMHSVYISHGNTLDDYDSADGYDYDCIENVGKNKVLVKRIEFDQDEKHDRFTCLHFVRRSPAVVQLRMAEYAETAESSLCNDANLKNNDTTLVHFHAAMWHKVLEKIPYMTCGLEGGYFIDQWYDQDKNEGCTVDVENSLRIEDECDIGSRLQITGESEKCPSPMENLNVYKEPLTCIASWKDGNYLFSVATDEWNSFFVCLRFPQTKGKQFEMYIFLDGICDSTENILHSKKYKRLQMRQFIVPDLCSDYSPHCTLLSKEDCVGAVPNTCRKSCNVCPHEKTWYSSKLPEEIQGDWYLQTSAKPGKKVTITERSMEFPHSRSWSYFGESPCKRSRIGHQKKASEYMLVSSSINGCLPRVATVMVNTFSTSVIGLQLSQSASSELGLVNETSTWSNDMESMCEPTQYSQDDERLRNKYHTTGYGWQNLVQDVQYPNLDQCELTDDQEFEVTLKSGATCKGHLNMRTLGDSFDMVIDDCGKYNSTVDIPGGIGERVRYECMARFTGAQDWNTYIITRTPGEMKNVVNETYVCWYLAKGKNGYLLPISSCDDLTDTDVSQEQPLASVHLINPETDNNSGHKLQFHVYTSGLLLLLLSVFN